MRHHLALFFEKQRFGARGATYDEQDAGFGGGLDDDDDEPGGGWQPSTELGALLKAGRVRTFSDLDRNARRRAALETPIPQTLGTRV